MKVRWMIRRDMPEVLAIAAFYDGPDEEMLIKWLRRGNTIGMVVEAKDESLVGFMVYNLWKTKISVVYIATAWEHIGEGIPGVLAEKLISKLSADRRSLVDIYVPEQMVDMQVALKRLEFNAIGMDQDTICFRFEPYQAMTKYNPDYEIEEDSLYG